MICEKITTEMINQALLEKYREPDCRLCRRLVRNMGGMA